MVLLNLLSKYVSNNRAAQAEFRNAIKRSLHMSSIMLQNDIRKSMGGADRFGDPTTIMIGTGVNASIESIFGKLKANKEKQGFVGLSKQSVRDVKGRNFSFRKLSIVGGAIVRNGPTEVVAPGGKHIGIEYLKNKVFRPSAPPGQPPAVQTGRLVRSITRDTSDIDNLTVRVGTNLPYGKYLELGTGPYVIVPKDPTTGPKALSFYVGRGAQRLVVGKVHHPGIRPRPFLRPALDRNRGKIAAAWAEVL